MALAATKQMPEPLVEQAVALATIRTRAHDPAVVEFKLFHGGSSQVSHEKPRGAAAQSHPAEEKMPAELPADRVSLAVDTVFKLVRQR